MTIRSVALAIIAITALGNLALRISGFIDEESYWRGGGFIVILICAFGIIVLDYLDTKKK